MPKLTATASLLAIAAFAAAPALAQVEPAQAPDTAQEGGEDAVDSGEEIVVTADRIRGQVDTDVPPVLELEAEEIASYGAGSIEELIELLAPQTGSGRGRGDGRPVFLINGQRVGGFREFRRYPPEAIEKVEVLPEEVALQFGFPADQRVVNFILKDNYASREVEGEFGAPFRGGTSNGEVELSQLTIAGDRRLNIGFEFGSTSLLTEDERDIIQTTGSAPTVPTDPDPAPFRSLRADSENWELDATLNSSLGEAPGSGTFSVNGGIERSSSRSLSGLDVVTLTDGGATAVRTLDADPLTRRNRSTTVSLGGSLNKPIGDWLFDTTLEASRSESTTLIDRRRDAGVLQDLVDAGELEIDGVLPGIPAAGVDRAESTSYAADAKATLRGNPFMLPAGEANLTFDTGYSWNRIESTDTRTAMDDTFAQTRGNLSAGVNLGLPIASEREGFLGGLGELSLNLAAGVNHLSDFGTLADATAGLSWRPTERLSLQASYIWKEAAPSLSQLGDPVVTDFNVPVFDFTRGESVLASIVTGGNPDLAAETQRDIKLSANYELDLFDRANIVVEYFRNRSDDVTQSFPLLTPAIEAAFPDRVVRDTAGNLVSIDRRPITFAGTKSSRLRYGINVFGRVGRAEPEAAPGGDGGGRGGWRGRMSAAAPQPPANGGEGPPAPQAAAPAPGDAAPGTPGRRFDPARMEQMRQTFCATPAGETPDLSGVPERMLERLKGEDGQIDPAKVEALRIRLCSAEGAAAGGQFRRMDPERFAALRQTLCADPAAEIDVATLPEEVQARLRDANGQIDPTRLAEFRNRICAMPAPEASGEAGGEGQERGGRVARSGGESRAGGGRFGGGQGQSQGRWNLGLYHTIEFENEVLVAPGGPVLDQLSGQAFGTGVPRHKIELEGGLFYKGIGLRASGNYESATRIDGSGLPGSQDLFFDDIATFDLRLFANLEQQEWLTGGTPGFWKGTRLSFSIDNVFDAQQRVTDGTGTVPLSYQPQLIDPLGRTFEIEFRKLF
ncbi:TonB-dependent receptor domain-containing protein [Pelagerythrobacter sp.]|uniref:TonB-dependent receptor domain-containing protein n=1 Tax=Pelagerythrobacter sp. TaxID=2800702 RepID=UPI0035B232AF